MPQLEPERLQFTSADGLSIACVKWSSDQNIRGVVQIAHGLGEQTFIDGDPKSDGE
jgi:alpha-beta hydrolase superfamily lysophospholipase